VIGDISEIDVSRASDDHRRCIDSPTLASVQRTEAKHLLFEQAYDAADSQLHDPQVVAQMERVLSITQFSLAPHASAHQALDTLWRTLMHTAIQQTQVAACMLVQGQEQRCKALAEAGKPLLYAPLAAIPEVQQAEIKAIVETVFNATVPLPPIRAPVLHWDAEMGRTDGHHPPHLNSDGEDACEMWVQGIGEPRTDSVHGRAASRSHSTEIVPLLQGWLVQHYLLLQLPQLLEHIEEWDVMLEPDVCSCNADRTVTPVMRRN
jgi:hypothetical protein